MGTGGAGNAGGTGGAGGTIGMGTAGTGADAFIGAAAAPAATADSGAPDALHVGTAAASTGIGGVLFCRMGPRGVCGVVVGAGAACVLAVCAAWPDPAVEAATAAGSELDGVLCVDWGLCDTSAAVASASAAAGARADAAGGVVCAAPVLCVDSLLAACASAVCAAPGTLRYSAGVGEREDSGTEALRLVGQAGQVHECQRFPLGR
jgi:hypothetical protein